MAVGLAKKTSRGDLKRKRILDALHRCIIAKGYAKTTLAEIATEAGVRVRRVEATPAANQQQLQKRWRQQQ